MRSCVGVAGVLTPGRAERRHVAILLCRAAFTRDLTHVTRFLEAVWENSKRAEDWVGKKRLTGRERDEYHEMIVEGIGRLVEAGAGLARRSGLTTILQRYQRTVRRYLPQEKTGNHEEERATRGGREENQAIVAAYGERCEKDDRIEFEADREGEETGGGRAVPEPVENEHAQKGHYHEDAHRPPHEIEQEGVGGKDEGNEEKLNR